MTRWVWCLALTLLPMAADVVRAEVNIPVTCRVKNRPPGRCGWCALETLARLHGLEAMYGLTETHPCLCGPHSLEECLTSLGVHYRIQYPRRYSSAILRYAIRENLGAAVGLRSSAPGVEKHIVTLVDFTADTVKVIDPNDGDGRVRRLSRDEFLDWWDGFALVLEPESHWARNKEADNSPRLAATRRGARGPALPSRSRMDRGSYGRLRGGYFSNGM